MDKDREYEMLAELERETTSTRHTTFTAILGVSFILPGLAVQATDKCPINILGLKTDLCALVFFLGFVFYAFAVFHYRWYHRHAHLYRKRLKELEEGLGISIYRLRMRPQIGPFKLHFEWALYIIGGVYSVGTIAFVGWRLFLVGVLALLLSYIVLMIANVRSPVEPMEER
jgi:hypothetical protein